jgi:outer membrane receptor protein involved in Fe transport
MEIRHGRVRRIALYLGLSLAVCATLLLTSRITLAQEVTGGITGTVTDPSGAAVPNATVTATNVQMGTTWPTQTNSAGVYNLPRLPIGEYSVKVAAKGFETVLHPAFQLQMNQIARIDVKLSVGAVTQTVSVTAAPPLLQTDTMQVGLVTSTNFNENLPLATGNFIQLTLLTPGATTVDPSSLTNGQRTGGGGRPYVNGNREEANDFMLNGVDNNQISDNLTSYQPNVDAIQEFDVVTNNAPAQYGQFMGGAISVTLKSGTDQYHGDAFEFLRNNALDANSWSNNWQGVPTAAERWNRFGATFGGPVPLTHHKLFFFMDYMGARLDFPPSTSAFTVMTPAERAGDFSQWLKQPTPIQLYSPCASLTGPCTAPTTPGAVRLPYPGNIITNTIDPVAAKLFASGKYPNAVNNLLQNNAFNTSGNSTNVDQGDLKMDYMVNEKNHVWGSYSDSFQTIPASNSVLLLGQTFNNSPFHAGVIDWTHTFSPSLVMDAKMGLNRIYLNNGQEVTGLGNFAESIGIADGNINGPGMGGIDFTSAVTNLGTPNSEELFADTTWEPTVDFMWTHDRHSFHFGLQLMRHDINTFYAGNNGKFGQLDYNGQYTSGPNPANLTAAGSSLGLAEADFYLGLPQTVELGINGATWGQRQWVAGTYAQDDWRVTDNLTLNLGLRWEYDQPWYEAYNRQANFGLISGTEYLAGQGGCPYSSCRGLYNAYWKDFEPRIGFAYTPSFLGKGTVLRGAYTISSFLEGTGTNLRLPLNPPFQTETSATYNTAPTVYFPGSTTDQGYSVLASPSNPLAGALIRLWDPNVMPAIVQQWNFSVEHQFPGQMLLSVGYVGQHGTHLMIPMPYLQKRLPGLAGCPSTATAPCNSPYISGNPTLQGEISQISGTASMADQAYDALQTSLTKHLTQGMEFQLSYTYSKGLSNNIGYYGDGGQAGTQGWYPQDLYNMVAEWGPSYFSDTHSFTASYTYQLPFGAGKRFGSNANRAVKAVLGGWETSGILTYHTGFPLTIYANDLSGTNSRGFRADCIGPDTYPDSVFPTGGIAWFGQGSFAQPAAGTFGSCAQGTTSGPGLTDWDTGFHKNFSLSRSNEARELQFRAEFINFLNHPIFNAPAINLGPTLGQVTSSQYQRTVQFALKLYF